MDPYVLLALITSASSLLVSVMTHVKHSRCWNCEMETRDNVQPEERRALIPTQPEIQEEYTVRSRANSNSRAVYFDEKNIREER